MSSEPNSQPEDTKQKISCEHDFAIMSQHNSIIDQDSVSQGSAVFKQTCRCVVCSFETITKTDVPICIDCRTPLEAVSKAESHASLAEFQKAIGREGGLDTGGGLARVPSPYRCPSCK